MTRTTARSDARWDASRWVRSRGALWALVAGVALVAGWSGGVSFAPSAGVLPDGVGPVVLLGLTTVRDDGIDALVEKIERVRDGETDVTFEADSDDDLGDLNAAVGNLADDLVTCRAERAGAEDRSLQAPDDGRSRLEASNRALRRLAAIGADAGVPLDEKIQRVLDLGRERLDTDGAFLSAIDETADVFEFSHTSGTEDLLPPGTIAPMEETYCRETVDGDRVFAVTNASESGWEGDPAFERWGLETYVGAPISVAGSLEGTLAFVDQEPHDRPFTDDERAFVELASRWMGYELERERRQRELERTTYLLEAAQRLARVVGWETDVTGEPPYESEFSGAIGDLLGLDADDVTIEDLLARADPDYRERRRAQFERRLEAGEEWEHETPATTPDGERRWIHSVGEPVYEDGDLVAFRGAIQDVTERKERERELEQTTSLLSRAEKLADVGGWAAEVTDEGPRDPVWTDTLYDIFGLDADAEPPLEEGFEYVHPDDRDRHRAALERAASEGEPWDQEIRIVTDDGTERWVHTIGEPHVEDGDVVWLSGSMQDVTDRKEREETLRETTETLEAMIEASPAAIACVTPEGIVTNWNTAAERIFGWSAAEVEGDRIPIVPDDERAAFECFLERVRSGEVIERAEATRQRKDGTLIDVTISAAPLHDDADAVVGIVAVFEDVTDRKEAERALRERQRRLARYRDYTDEVLDAIEDVFYVIDDEGTFLRWNETLPAVTGYEDADIEAMNALDFFPESEHDRILEAIDRVFAAPGSRRVEAPLVTTDGEEIPYEFVASTVENPDGGTELVGIGRDVTDRKRRQAALERATELLDQAQGIARVGGWEFDVETGELTLTDEFRRLHGIGPDESVEIEDVLAAYHPDDLDYIRETFDAAVESGESYDMDVRLRTAEGATRWVRALGEPVETADGTTKIRGSIQDVTEAKEREEALRTLHDAAQGLLQTESATEVAELVVETAAEVLDVSGVCLYQLDAEAGQLVPRACTEGYESVTGGAPPVTVGAEDDVVWNSYATGTRRVFDDSDDVDGDLFSDHVGGGLVVPVGDHGVLVVTTAQAGVAARTRRLVETLVATTEAAFDRLESEATLRERDAELESRNRRLQRQVHLTDVIRRVDRSLVGANSQAEIEAAVCEELADAPDVAFAWIGSVDAAGETLVPGTWAGAGETYLDSVSLSLDADTTEPAVVAARSGEPTVVSNVLADVSNDRWRKEALDSDFRSAVAVPIAVEDYGHGVLAVYADEADAFGDLELTVFAELGQTIANAINAVKTREALHADTLLELTLRVEAPDTFLAQVARRADATVEYVGIGSQSGDETGVFFATDGAADVESALADLVSVSDHRLLSEDEDRRVFEAAVTGPVLPAKLLRFGAQPASIRATPTDVTVTVSVPTSTDVREFVETLRGSYPAVELVGRRNVSRATRTRQELVSDLLEGLTDRQLEVLRTAYYAGYFDWPRGSSGEEIAEMLGITQPTVSRHLRLSQRELLARLLEEEPVSVGAS